MNRGIRRLEAAAALTALLAIAMGCKPRGASGNDAGSAPAATQTSESYPRPKACDYLVRDGLKTSHWLATSYGMPHECRVDLVPVGRGLVSYYARSAKSQRAPSELTVTGTWASAGIGRGEFIDIATHLSEAAGFAFPNQIHTWIQTTGDELKEWRAPTGGITVRGTSFVRDDGRQTVSLTFESDEPNPRWL